MEIKFNKLKISDDRLSLDIDIDLVNGLGESYVIKSVTIDDQSTYRGNRDNKPSGKPLFYIKVDSTSYKATLYKEDMLWRVKAFAHCYPRRLLWLEFFKKRLCHRSHERRVR